MAAFMMTEVCTAVEVQNAVTGHRAGIYMYRNLWEVGNIITQMLSVYESVPCVLRIS
jgi:hypothetical protein